MGVTTTGQELISFMRSSTFKSHHNLRWLGMAKTKKGSERGCEVLRGEGEVLRGGAVVTTNHLSLSYYTAISPNLGGFRVPLKTKKNRAKV